MSGNTTDKIGHPQVRPPRVEIKSLDDLRDLLIQSRTEKANDPNLPESERQKYRTALAGMNSVDIGPYDH